MIVTEWNTAVLMDRELDRADAMMGLVLTLERMTIPKVGVSSWDSTSMWS